MAIKTNAAGMEDVFALYVDGEQVDNSPWQEIEGVISPKNADASVQIKGEEVAVKSDIPAGYVNPNFDANGQALKNLSGGVYRFSQSLAPAGVNDLTNKKYVDDAVAGITPPADPNWSAGGTAQRQLSMGTNKLVSVGTPTASTDATTKAYVDGRTFFGTNGIATRDIRVGSAYTLFVDKDPTATNHATNKKYVDDQIAGVVPPVYVDPNWDEGGNSKRSLSMRGVDTLQNVPPPVGAGDVANKVYVDEMAKTLNFPELRTTAKTIVGALNELEELIK